MLGFWNHEEYAIELQLNAKPYHARAYPIPKIHEQTLHTEVERLCSIGVLRKVNHSEWAALTFIIPKKNGTVWFISDFRELKEAISYHPKIQDLLLKQEGFQYATSLDLNMGYYHIELSPFSHELCTIVLLISFKRRCLRLWTDSNSFVRTWTIVSAWQADHGKITLKSSSKCSCDWKAQVWKQTRKSPSSGNHSSNI